MGVTPTRTGELREDQFWLLKSCQRWNFYDAEAGAVVKPVKEESISLDIYRMPEEKLQLHAMINNSKIHGRRVNDEVELFEWDDGKETPGLREALEAKGLTVRTYAPESVSKDRKFSRSGAKGSPGNNVEEPTKMEKLLYALKQAIKQMEDDFDVTINHAVLADSRKLGDHGEKMMILLRFDARDFCERPDQDSDSINVRNEDYTIVGVLEYGELRLNCTEEEFDAFFKSRPNGGHHVTAKFHDMSQEYACARREAIKAEKRQAKRHRRRVTASTITTPSEQSTMPEDNEALKARQREKNKAKKKAQKERKKCEQIEREGAARKKVELKDADVEGEMELVATDENCVMLKSKNGTIVVQPKRRLQIISIPNLESAVRATKTTRKKASISSDDESETELETGLRVLNATTDEAKAAARAAAANGQTVMVAHPMEDSKQDTLKEASDLAGLKYVGRGL